MTTHHVTETGRNPHGNVYMTTRVPFLTEGDVKRVLLIHTSKTNSGALATTARAVVLTHLSIPGVRALETFAPFSDFSERMTLATYNRITQKVIDHQHQQALLQVDLVVGRATLFYKQKVKVPRHANV